jgi:hypothetical protein
MDGKQHDVQTVWTDDTCLWIIVDGTVYRIRWSDCSRRLLEADATQRTRFEISPSGYGIHWPEIDEDLAIASLLLDAETVAQTRNRGSFEYVTSRSSDEVLKVAEPQATYRMDSVGSIGGHMIDHQLLTIARSLPPSRAAQLMDFARFLEAQSLAESLERQDESMDAIDADNARWDALLATDESQALLERLADEALAELRAGKTKPMAFTDDGRLVPG